VHPDRLAPKNDPLDLLDALLSLKREELERVEPALFELTFHDDEDVRLQAIRALLVHLKSTSRHQRASEALVNDTSFEIRRTAAFGLAATSTAATRGVDERLLAEVVSNEAEVSSVRGAAYEALALLSRKLDLPPLTRSVSLARDVDWTWVRSFLT
jgi:HEAT repeat protein